MLVEQHTGRDRATINIRRYYDATQSERKGGERMARKTRSDAKVETVEKKLGIGNSLTNPDGRNARSDKRLGSLRRDWDRKKK